MSFAVNKKYSGALLLATLLISVCGPVLSYDDYEVDTSGIGKDSEGVVNSGQILELGLPSANALRLEGENYLRQGQLSRAITVLQRSVEMAPTDLDSRIMYADALERKLMRQAPPDRDPSLFNFIVKQWLVVAKSGEFGDQISQGYTHLMKLTGTIPKKREKEKKYLERVLIPEDGSVKVTIGRAPTDKDIKTSNIDDTVAKPEPIAAKVKAAKSSSNQTE